VRGGRSGLKPLRWGTWAVARSEKRWKLNRLSRRKGARENVDRRRKKLPARPINASAVNFNGKMGT